MPSFYLESSALLKRYRVESGSDVVRSLFGLSPRAGLFTSSLTITESVSVVTRLYRGRVLTTEEYGRVLRILWTDVDRLTIEPITESVMADAIAATIRFALRAPDAIHLATAVALPATIRDRVFVCSDETLCKAAAASRLPVLNPTVPSALATLRRLAR
ncbi:MAG: type II toxin-antitoxin system VapC family toxin [Chloroflexi bacterium]|nr:type II toxin-antitoxin system VapC family toxin [Chloroflexota bacterium]